VVSDSETGHHPVRVDADEEMSVDADRVRMSEALREVVENAARFSPGDSEILVRSRREDSKAIIEVEDRGPGLPERAFERFARVRPPGFESVPGAGLGLSIARSHARAHGGDVSASPAGGSEGTIVRITLPLAKGG
jgi:signal transduction histidine kinase